MNCFYLLYTEFNPISCAALYSNGTCVDHVTVYLVFVYQCSCSKVKYVAMTLRRGDLEYSFFSTVDVKEILYIT
jgi:hypothetical protein